MKRLGAVGLCLTFATATAVKANSAAAETVGAAHRWHPPACKVVSSDGSLTFTRNAGRTLTPTTGRMQGVKYVSDLGALATPDTLLAVDQKGRIYRSTNAGCTWSLFHTLTQGWWSISPASDGRAYVWDLRGDHVVLVEGDRVTPLPAFEKTRMGGFVRVAADRWRPNHMRAVTNRGLILDSRDGGRSFRQIGKVPPVELNGTIYDAQFDQWNLDRIVIGMSDDGIYVTSNPGRTA